MNIVEYALQLKDNASGELNRITQHMRENIRVSREMSRANRAAGDSVGKSFNIGSLLKKGAITGAVVAAGRAAGELFGSSMRSALERQQIQTSFNVLAGGSSAGKALTDQLVALQRDTILGGEVFQNAQTMMSFGFDSTEVMENMKMLGDVSMGNTERFKSLTLAFSQVRAAGRLTGQDLLQFINAGFNPLQQMSEKTGKSMAVLKKEVEDGNVSFADVQQAFREATSEGGKFENMLATIAKTPAGKAQQLAGKWGEVMVAIGNAFMPLLSYAMDLADKMLPFIENFIEPFNKGLETAIGFVKNLIGDFSSWSGLMGGIAAIWREIWDTVVYRVNILSDMASDLIEFIKTSILLRDIFLVIGKVVSMVGSMIKYVVDMLKWLWDNIVMPILNGMESIWRWLRGYEKKSGKQEPPQKTALPAVSESKDLLTEIARNTRSNAGIASGAGKSVSSGGQRIININVNKLLDSINFHETKGSDIPANIEEVVLEVLSRVLVQGAANAV